MKSPTRRPPPPSRSLYRRSSRDPAPAPKAAPEAVREPGTGEGRPPQQAPAAPAAEAAPAPAAQSGDVEERIRAFLSGLLAR